MPANPRPRVLLLIPHLGGGGAERVMALLARGLDAEKYELHLGLVTQAQTGGEVLPSWVHVHALGASKSARRGLPPARAGSPAQAGPDSVRNVSPELSGALAAPLSFRERTRVLVRQNGTVSAALSSGLQPWYTRLLYRLLYRHADRVICQTRSMASDLAAKLRLPESRIAVLPNPVDVDEIRNFAGVNPELKAGQGPHLLAVGRLSREKGFDLLLRAFASVRGKFPEATLSIAGTGPEEAALKAECHELGVEPRGELCWADRATVGTLQGCDAFCACFPERRLAQRLAGGGCRWTTDCGFTGLRGRRAAAARPAGSVARARGLGRRACNFPALRAWQPAAGRAICPRLRRGVPHGPRDRCL